MRKVQSLHMIPRTVRLFMWLIAGFVLITSIACQSDDSSEKSNQNKIETPVDEQRKATIADVEKGIRAYIKTQTDMGDGYFSLEDDSLQLNLRLVRVHTEYLSVLSPGRYFACVDLVDTTGDVYDVDFFLAGKPDDMDVTETKVHKLNGKPFYTWKQQEDKTWHRIPVEDASNELLGVIEGKDRFEFRYAVRLPEMTEPARMWIPLASSDDYQTIDVVSLKTPVREIMLKDQQYGNTIMYLEMKPEHSGEEIEIVYNVERTEKGPYKDTQPIPSVFRASTPLMPTGGRFSEIVYEVLADKQEESALVQARALYDYIIDNVRYAKEGKYGTGDANYACDSRSGNCTEFHSFFISLTRTAGIPARFAIGAAIPSERDDGGIDGYHCWAEFYADGKWWPVDISEGNKYSALATYYFGHHPANRIELSRGRDIEVSPGPQSGPIPFHAYPVLETGGKEIPVKTTFSFIRDKTS